MRSTKAGVFAYIADADAEELQSAIDVAVVESHLLLIPPRRPEE